MTEMTLERIAELEADSRHWLSMDDLGNVKVGGEELRALLTLARRALESESRPQSQGVPTVTREHRDVAEQFFSGVPQLRSTAVDHFAQLIATREAAAYEAGRSRAAGDGWVAISPDMASLPDSDDLVELCNIRHGYVVMGTLDMTDDSEGHGKPYWVTHRGECPLARFTHWRAYRGPDGHGRNYWVESATNTDPSLPAPPSDSGKGESDGKG